MGKGKRDKRMAEAAEHGALVDPAPNVQVLPAFSPDWAREHLKVHHGIKVAKDINPVLAASIHQADHMAAGIGGRPLVVAHYHTADKHEASE